MIINAPAKINLALDVLADRPDGYHEVDMVMQNIALADEIFFEPGEEIELTCSNPDIPTDKHNLAWRAADLIRRETGCLKGIKIHIEKRIPVAAGLAGGSTDAAAVLIGLNQLWKLGLSQKELMNFGVKLGADVPFCILRQTSRAEGIGEKLSTIDSKLHCNVLLITPDVPVSTALVYQSIITPEIKKHPNINEVITALETGDIDRLTKHWGNVLEEVVLKKFPMVAELKESLICKFGLNRVLMSGSGPSVFALEPDLKIVDQIRTSLPSTWFCSMTHFI